jgi:hypothetical protein
MTATASPRRSVCPWATAWGLRSALHRAAAPTAALRRTATRSPSWLVVVVSQALGAASARAQTRGIVEIQDAPLQRSMQACNSNRRDGFTRLAMHNVD